MNRLRQKYQQVIRKTLAKELHIDNILATPRLTKLVINVGVTDDQHRDQAVENVASQVGQITGQMPSIRRARKAIAGFKLREGDPVGVSATLRGERMYEFLDKLISVVLPRVKDFQGLSTTSFDAQGNYNFGLTEQIIFPEINYDKIDKVRGLQITLVTSSDNRQHAQALLTHLGIPFAKPGPTT